MATYHELLTLSDTTPTEVTPGPNHSGLDITVQNVDPAASVYVGAADVTASNYGFQIVPGGAFSIEMNPDDRLYVISDVNESPAALLRVFLEEL